MPAASAVKDLLSNWALIQPLRIRNYLMLWIGSVISYIGANLTFVAFPWLVLKLTDDALMMGTVLAVAGVPRALFMLIGGAMVDRYSPRTVMIWSTVFRLILMTLLAILVYTRLIEMWMVFVIAFLFGTLDAFFWPASSAILPSIVSNDLLPAGNSLLQGCGQLSLLVGPALAGVIITLSSGEGVEADLDGIALVFTLDAMGFVVSLGTLMLIRLEARTVSQDPFNLAALGRSLKEGFWAMWRDTPVRLMTIAFSIFTLFFRGPYMVGIPVLADARFEQGALAFGLISSAFGLGALLGIVAAGSFRRPPEHFFGPLLFVDMFVLGSMFFAYAYAERVETAMFFTALGGLLDGYLVVLLMSWLQTRIPEDVIGRVMSFIMFFNNGMAPLSAAVAGWLLTISLVGTFLGTGVILITICLLGLMISDCTTEWRKKQEALHVSTN